MRRRYETMDFRHVGGASGLHLVAGDIKRTAIEEDGARAPLWLAVALSVDGRPAALGLYKGRPDVGEIMMLFAGAQSGADLGPQWTCDAATAVSVDHSILWRVNEVADAIAARGITVYAMPPAGSERQRAHRQFAHIARLLADALKKHAIGRGEDGAVLVTPTAAARVARLMRDERADPAIDPAR